MNNLVSQKPWTFCLCEYVCGREIAKGMVSLNHPRELNALASDLEAVHHVIH